MSQNTNPALRSDHIYQVAIIGAGIAGSYCAQRLSAAGLDVAIIEKSRGTGGRASSRRLAQSSTDQTSVASSCELGAAFFNDDQTELQHDIESWLAQGLIAHWPEADIADTDGKVIKAYTGVPRMSALTRQLCNACTIYSSQRVAHVDKTTTNGQAIWHLRDDRYQSLLQASRLIITAPAAQSAQLLCSADTPSPLLHAAHQAMQHCRAQWVAVVTLDTDTATALRGMGSVLDPEHRVLSRAIRDSAKPQRSAEPERWILHANLEWSESQRDAAPQWIGEQLLDAFKSLYLPQPSHTDLAISDIHRWRLGRHISTGEQSSAQSLWDAKAALGIAADWLSDGSITGAMRSAKQLCEQIVQA